MEYVHYIASDGELCHWGIKGQKWGIRRYQNKDGSLTPAGRKRYGDDASSDTPKKKSVKDMTDDEIRTAIARKKLENEYRTYHPEPIKKDGFAKQFLDEAIKPAVKNAGKDFIEKALKKAGADILKDKVDPDSLEAIEAMNKKLRARITNSWLRRGIDTSQDWGKADTQYKLNKQMKEDDDKAAKAEAAKAEADKKRKLDDDMRKYQEYNDKWYENDSLNHRETSDGTYRNRGVGQDYVGTNKGREIAIYNKPVSDLSLSMTSRGENYVRDILSKPKGPIITWNDARIRYGRKMG